MENSKDEKDESSIKPVSALRSRFENLVTDASVRPASPVGGRSPLLPPIGTPTTGRPSTPLREGTWPVQRPFNLNEDALARPPRRSPSPPKSRPQSISGASPTRKWAPVVTVDSPRSPDRKHAMSVDLSNSNVSTPRGSFDIARTGTDSPPKPPAARPPSRTPTPALEARINALSGSIITPKAASDGVNTAPPTPDLKPKTQTSSVPPPVNRAGKPTIPLKPSNLTKKSEGLSAPEPSHAELTDQSVSPFSTPPSSGAGSPHQRTNSDATSHGRKDSELSPSYFDKVRGNSDASWVESIRTNSDPSITNPPQRTRHESDTSFLARARAGSNASFVEASTLPEDWHHFQPPPIHHNVAARRDPLPNGLSRPARYRPIGSQEQTAAGDLLSDIPEDRPRLPVRPEVQRIPGRGSSPPKSYSRSGRTSPVKEIAMRKSMDAMRRAATMDVVQQTQSTPRIPATKSNQRSALLQGFDRGPLQPTAVKSSTVAPPIPAPRKSREASVVQERHAIPTNNDYQATPRKSIIASRVPAHLSVADTDGQSHDEDDVVAPTFNWSSNHHTGPSDYPDSSRASRRPPKFGYRPWHIPTEHDARTFAVCGEYVVTTGGHRTKAFNLRTGEQLVDLDHEQHGISKVCSLAFKPSATQEDEGKRVWLGTSIGEIHELDLPSQSIVHTRRSVHTRRDVIRMYRYASELWTLDDSGELYVWKADSRGMPSLESKFESFRTPKGHTFSIALGRHLWIATGKDIRVFAPSATSDSEFHVLRSPLSQPGTGEVCSGATLSGKPDLVYFGHSDGKVSIYNRHDFSCLGVVNVSMYKLSSLAGVGEYLWAGFNTGMIVVYDVSSTPWRVVKEWQAHEKSQVLGISAERSAVWKMGRLQVVTLGTDNLLRIWDGMLEEDWLESKMEERDAEYCSFRDVEVQVLTWNAGAAKPYYLQGNKEDENFFRKYLNDYKPPDGRPDIFVFGFQELVDLEDKKVTAKSFFKVSKKKDANEQEHMSHQYRAWQDHLTKCIDEYMPPDELYVQLHSASLVGLFTCVFVKSSLRDRIRLVQAVEVKRGMGGIYGNKGALVLRMVIDDSSLCFINCHLAAGQTQTIHRNNDIAAILESDELPAYPLGEEGGPGGAQHSDVFRCGGDGSMILDHEICVLNGDLNYRIDTMGRDTVIKHIKAENFARLLERDQLLISRRKNPGFRLRAFQENPITFPPTYKYNLHSDEYDTSEKRRAPAWCDRILYRGMAGKVVMSEYKRWDRVRVSDHRPVSGRLKMKVKTVDAAKRKRVAGVCEREFEEVTKRVARAVQLEHLINVLGLTNKEATDALSKS